MVGTVEETANGGLRIAWETTAHLNDPRIVRASRTWQLEGDSLSYEGYIATTRAPDVRRHIEARLTR
jgi:hypothetical protein